MPIIIHDIIILLSIHSILTISFYAMQSVSCTHTIVSEGFKGGGTAYVFSSSILLQLYNLRINIFIQDKHFLLTPIYMYSHRIVPRDPLAVLKSVRERKY